jgi:hypothetical protein
MRDFLKPKQLQLLPSKSFIVNYGRLGHRPPPTTHSHVYFSDLISVGNSKNGGLPGRWHFDKLSEHGSGNRQ